MTNQKQIDIEESIQNEFVYERQFYFAQILISNLICNNISKADLKVLNELFIYISMQSKDSEYLELKSFEINQTEFAKQARMQQSNVSRSLKKLISAQLIIKENELYRFNIKFDIADNKKI